jgi:mRNA interferase MazF
MLGGSYPRRGDIHWVNFDLTSAAEEARGEPVGSEEKGWHPALIVSNDVGNKWSPLVIVAAMTSKPSRRRQTWDVWLPENQPLKKAGRIQGNHLYAIDKQRLGRKLGTLSAMQLVDVDQALRVSLGLEGTTPPIPDS